MRRLVVLLTLLALALPVVAGASTRTAGDGTLSVRDLDGYIAVRAKGAVIGHCTECTIVLDELPGAEPLDPIVSGGKGIDTDADDEKERWSGKDLRWKVVGASFRMIVRQGADVDLSVVGRGRFVLRGTDGSYSVNGATAAVVPPVLAFFQLRAATPS